MNSSKYVSNVQEVEILVRDENGIGMGNARLSQDDITKYIAEMYQDRLKLEFTNDDELLETLAEGKLYIGDDNSTLVEAINSVLNFWFVAPITENKIKEVPQFNSLKEALSYFSATSQLPSTKVEGMLGN